MAENSNEGPLNLDPQYERRRLIDYLVGLFDANPDAMAIHVTEGLDVIRILSGQIEPLEDGDETYFVDEKTLVVAGETQSGQWAKVSFSHTWMTIQEYDLAPTPKQLEDLGLVPDALQNANQDSATVFKLSRAIFTAEAAESALGLMLKGDPAFLRGLSTDPTI